MAHVDEQWKLTARRRGVTLVELLVVLGIFALLLGVAIPVMRYANEDRKTREAARELNAFIVGAQARAVETGRPVGIWLERAGDEAPGYAACMRLYMAEVSPAYTGDVVNATVWVNSNGQLTFEPSGAALTLEQTESLVGVDDSFAIKFAYKGPTYFGLRNANGYFVAPGTTIPGADSSPGVQFQLYRWPERSMVPPLELPNGIAIDLAYSGVTATGYQFSPEAITNQTPAPMVNYQPVIVMFNPSGAIDSLYYGVWQPGLSMTFLQRIPEAGAPAGSVYLLIGQYEKVGESVETNLADQSNLWLVFNHITGTVASAENAGAVGAANVAAARRFARSAQAIGGGE